MNDIQIFKNPLFGYIRTSGTSDEPLFCASDICRALGYANSRDAIAKHCDEGDVAKRDIIDNLGRNQSASFVNESGMYALIFGSKMETAKLFKHWVTSEVLPSIRKHGAYMTEATIEKVMNDPDSWIKLLTTLKDEREQRIIAEHEKQRLAIENQKQAEKIEQDAPKVEHHDLFMNAEHGEKNVSIRMFLSQCGIKGERRFWDWMVNDKEIVYRNRCGRAVPYAKYRHLFSVSDRYNEKNNWSGTQLMVNPAGKTELAKMYFKDHPENFLDNSKIKTLNLCQ